MTILNRVLRPEYLEGFREFHAGINSTFDVDKNRDRLLWMRRRLRRGNTGKAIQRLNDLRNQMVAHLDSQPEFAKGYPLIVDMTIVLAAVANIVISLIRLIAPGRRIQPALGRQDARLQARALCLAIQPA
jgi:hypothetical protein